MTDAKILALNLLGLLLGVPAFCVALAWGMTGGAWVIERVML